jgi:hypothetical protein
MAQSKNYPAIGQREVLEVKDEKDYKFEMDNVVAITMNV